MTQYITGLGIKEAEFLAVFSFQEKTIFSVEQARTFWGNTASTINMLGKLETKGWLKRD